MHHYNLQIATCLYRITSDLPCYFREEEKAFVIEDGDIAPEGTVNEKGNTPIPSRIMDTTIHAVMELPLVISADDYESSGVKIYHREGREIRTYYASFLSDAPVYAQSCLEGDRLEIYVKMTDGLWFNPNIRIWNLLHLEQALLSVDALILHCSYMTYQGQAILFSAPSGTGKTTQAKLWEKHYGSRIINGDKAVIQRRDGRWYACGYPYHGSAIECENMTYPIRAIVVVRQWPTEEIITESGLKKVRDIYSECTVNSWQEEHVIQAFDLLTDLVSKVDVVKQKCTMNQTAAERLHSYLWGKNRPLAEINDPSAIS